MRLQNKEKNLAIIPAREGSKRLPHKNMMLFRGMPLIVHTIREAKASGIFDRIIVDTDSSRIAAIAKRGGAEVPFLRPKRLAGDNATSVAATLFLLRRLEEEGYRPDIVTYLQPTTPLREAGDIRACFELMRKDNLDAVTTVHKAPSWLYYFSRGGKLQSFFKSAGLEKDAASEVYSLNGGVYMLRTPFFLKKRAFVIDGKSRGVIIPWWRAIDIDYIDQFLVAEVLHKKRSQIKKKIRAFYRGVKK